MSSKKVLVAMSGGVDSSTAAAILKNRGFEVIGITMQIWDRSNNPGGCCGLDGIEDAKRIAYKLKIPHYVIDCREMFHENVLSNFYKEYSNGRTPNPCIRCNQYLKFDLLLEKVKQLGANYLATGHYARIAHDFRRKVYLLKRGVDLRKDQSYVLYSMNQEQMRHTLMPLGSLTKQKVRKIAHEEALSVAEKGDSQDICFIKTRSYAEFIEEDVPEGTARGPIIDSEGGVIGEHCGIINYTIGQRRKIGISSKEPLYVIRIIKESNAIVVGKREEVFGCELVAGDMCYTDGQGINKNTRAMAKIRYLHRPSPAVVSPLKNGKIKVKFDHPQWAITPGQAVVLYRGDMVIGGGTIL